MDIDSFQPSPVTTPTERPLLKLNGRQAVTGLTPPAQREAIVREVRPCAAAYPAVSGLVPMLTGTYILAPLAWLLLAPLFLMKFLPFVCKRYTLTNRRLMIRRGLARPQPIQEVALADIDEVRIDSASHNNFFHSATLEVVSQGKVVLRLPGVAYPEAFRHSILNAYRAWAPIKEWRGMNEAFGRAPAGERPGSLPS
jgi:hypothetical protein